jgi:uncharacterized surface protein with fasciclin (FAS1) repeats
VKHFHLEINMLTFKPTPVRLGLAVLATASLCATAFAKDFVPDRNPPSGGPARDIINTLKNGPALKGQPTFKIYLDALENNETYFDNELKGKGPYTVFAADDSAWKKIPSDDRTSLWSNHTKLKQVLQYQVIKGQKLDSTALAKMTTIKPMEGDAISISERTGSKEKKEDGLYVDKSRVKVADIECVNGIIHIVDRPLMPVLKQ